MKKLLLLGGSRYLLPVINKAHEMGIYVITCDYLPDNVAHKFSDQYCDVSIIDKDKVLKIARELKIDGVMSFACDPGVVTAAYVAEKMGLSFQGSYRSVTILQDKGLFREFLKNNQFNVPHAKRYIKLDEAIKDINYFQWPIIVKPVDSAGSKGVSKVEKIEDLKKAVEKAIGESHSGAFIIEDFLTFEGYHSSTDVFTVNGELKFITFSDQLFDSEADNPYTPAYIIWPTSMKNKYQELLTKEIQRLMILLKMKTGIYNIETCVGEKGVPYIMEVSPRGGGCKIAELQEYAFEVNLIETEIRQALGLPYKNIIQTPCNGFWCEMVIHADKGQSGIFKEMVIKKDIKEKYVKLIDMTVKTGDKVKPFTGANMALGDMFLRFDSREEMDRVLKNRKQWLSIVLE